MAEVSQKQKGSALVFILAGLFGAVVMIPYLGPATILPKLMADLEIPPEAVGYVVSIYLILCGFCMYIGSFIQSKLGYTAAIVTGVVANALGVLITAVAPNFFIFMIGRGLSGFGYGVALTVLMTITSMWFKGKSFTAANSFSSIASCIGISLTYAITSPLMSALGGSWRNVMWVYFAISAVYAVLCIIFVKVPPSMAGAIKAQRDAIKAGTAPKMKTGLTRPFKYQDYWMMLIHNIAYTCINTAILTYMTVYFTKEAGLALAVATLVGSVFSLAQIAGSLAGGVLTAVTGRRKPIMIIATIVYGISIILFVLAGTNVAVIFIAAALAGAAGFSRMPALSMYLIEETETYDPTLVGPASSMLNGIPMIANLIASVVIGTMFMGPLGYGKSIIILGVILLATLIPLFIMNEVGPHSKRARTMAKPESRSSESA